MSRITESLYSKYGINERKPLRESRKNRKLYERVSYPEDRMIAKNIEWDMNAIKLDKDAFDTEEEYLDFVKSLPNQVDLPKDIAYEYYYEFDDDEEEEAEEFVKDWISEWYGAGYPIKNFNIGERGMMLDSFNKKSLKESRKRNKKFFKESKFDSLTDVDKYDLDVLDKLKNFSPQPNKDKLYDLLDRQIIDKTWLIEALISVISDDQAEAIIRDVDYDEDLDESLKNEEWLAEDSFNVEDFVSGFKGTTKFKIRDAEDDVFVCSGNILDGKIVNIQDLVIDKNKIPSLIITSFTIDPKDGTLVLYSYVPEDLF